MVLYILGNGFDRNHNLNTSYNDYKKFLLNNYSSLNKKSLLPDLFENCKYLSIPKSDRWTDVEESLTIDVAMLVEDYLFSFDPQKRVNPESPTYEQQLQQIFLEANLCDLSFLNEIYDFVSTCYYQWIKSIDYSQIQENFQFEDNDVFVTFNYTPTLEETYNISPSRILHLHGYWKNIDETTLLGEPHITKWGDVIQDNRCRIILDEIQFGSINNNPHMIEEALNKKYQDDPLFASFYKQLIEKISVFCNWSYKNVSENAEMLRTFIAKKEIREVVILGHSLLGVDDFYYENIIVPQFSSCKWKIYCHDDESIKTAKEFAQKYDLAVDLLNC